MRHVGHDPTPGTFLLLRSLLLPCDGSPGSLMRTSVRMGTLTPDRQPPTVAKPPIAPDVHEALDVHGHFGAKSPLHLVVTLDLLPEEVDLLVGEIVRSAIWIDPASLQDLPGAGSPDPEDIGEGDLDSLVSRQINTSDTCHQIFSSVSDTKGSTPSTVSPVQPWRCLWRGFLLQITRTTPRRRITLQCSQMGFTLVLTFMGITPVRKL